MNSKVTLHDCNMASLKVISWNINSFKKRSTEILQYVLDNKIDVICLQETGTDDTFNPKVSGYCRYTIESNQGRRGLITYVRNTIPVRFDISDFGAACECIRARLFLNNYQLNIVNLYIPDGKLDTDSFPQYIHTEPTLLVGDFNARHSKLGSQGFTVNANGRKWYNYLLGCEDVRLIGDPQPTHILGGCLDYACLYADPYRECKMETVDSLLSDHFAIKVEINAQQKSCTGSRKRLLLKPEDKEHFVESLNAWYDDYAPNNVHDFISDLNSKIESLLQCPSRKSIKTRRGGCGNGNRKGANNNKNDKRWYSDDPKVKYFNKLVSGVAKKWRRNPSEENLEALKFVSKKSREAKMEAREKYWIDFVSGISKETSSRQIWKKINIAKGIKPKVAAHPDPQAKADQLMEGWAAASSFDSLPPNMQSVLNSNADKRRRDINHAVSITDDSDTLITKWELMQAIQHGKATAPGSDGITYDILNCLMRVRGNPLLTLFNMSYNTGELPDYWKHATIVPIPKPADPDAARPISLTSCYCKMMERIILKRLLFRIEDQLHDGLHGFMKGRSTTGCITSFLANKRAKYTVFLDLKSAFDKANRLIILHELCNMGVHGKLLAWIQNYLSNRTASVFFQGKQSRIQKLELGTPQGGVLSPTLFNVLMNIIAKAALPQGAVCISYADDVLIQAPTHNKMQAALHVIGDVCKNIGLVISTIITKAYTNCRDKTALTINNERIGWVEYYKYLGVYVGGSQGKIKEFETLLATCKARLRPMKAMAWDGSGASVAVLRTMYVSYVRSLVDYAAPALIGLGKVRLTKLEVIQNEAMRIILGAPTTAKVVNLRQELNLPSLADRIHEINTAAAVRILRDKRDTIPQRELINYLGFDVIHGYGWAAHTARDLLLYDVIDYNVFQGTTHAHTAPWNNDMLDITLPTSAQCKKDKLPSELKAQYLQVIHDLVDGDQTTELIYCDGSVDPNTGAAGAATAVMKGGRIYSEYDTQVRLHDWASSTHAELLALLIALKQVKNRSVNAIILSDSLSALQALSSRSPLYPELINNMRTHLLSIKNKRLSLRFVWIPSHVGIAGNEYADKLAKRASARQTIDYNLGLSIKQIRTKIRLRQEYLTSSIRQAEQVSSWSVYYYDTVALQTSFTYGRRAGGRNRETVYARIRLGYRYLWQCGVPVEEEKRRCRVCGDQDSHDLEHYILHCRFLNHFRHPNLQNIYDQAKYFLENDVITQILKYYKHFASAR